MPLPKTQPFHYVVGLALVAFLLCGTWKFRGQLAYGHTWADDPLTKPSKAPAMRRIEAFHAYEEAVRFDLAWHGLTLVDAATRVERYCEENFPEHLYHLDRRPFGGTLLEKIAGNLVDDFRIDLEGANPRAWPSDIVRRLEREMQSPLLQHS